MKMYDSESPHLYPLHIRTAYSELLGRLQDLQASQAMAMLKSCSLIVKRVGSGQYIFAQGRLTYGTLRQVYLAPADEAGHALMARFGKAKTDAAAENGAVDKTAKALSAAGRPRLDSVEWRVVNALAEGGIFRVGGVLVGTIAYRCIANLLGVKLRSAAAVTAGVDIGIKTIPVAFIPEVVRIKCYLKENPLNLWSESSKLDGRLDVRGLQPRYRKKPLPLLFCHGSL